LVRSLIEIPDMPSPQFAMLPSSMPPRQ
jgi:hypothetical protein